MQTLLQNYSKMVGSIPNLEELLVKLPLIYANATPKLLQSVFYLEYRFIFWSTQIWSNESQSFWSNLLKYFGVPKSDLEYPNHLECPFIWSNDSQSLNTFTPALSAEKNAQNLK